MGKQKDERRRFPRRRVRLRVAYWEEGAEKRSNAYTTDASGGGLFIEAARTPEIDTRFHLELNLSERPFFNEGIVVRRVRIPASAASVKKSGFALRMINLDEILFPGSAGATARATSADGSEDVAPGDEPTAPAAVDALDLDLSDPMRLLDTIRDEIELGCLFVPTGEAKAPGDPVTVRLRVPKPSEPILFETTVLQYLEAEGTVAVQTADPELLAHVDRVVNEAAAKGIALMLDLTDLERLRSTLETELRHGGVMVPLTHVPPVGSRVTLTIGLPSPAAPVKTTGRVVYESDEPPGAGLQLDDPESVIAALTALL